MAPTILLAAQVLTLHLICPGRGLDTKVGVTSGQAFASNGASATANVYQRKANAFDDEIEITLSATPPACVFQGPSCPRSMAARTDGST